MFHGKIATFETVNFGDLISTKLTQECPRRFYTRSRRKECDWKVWKWQNFQGFLYVLETPETKHSAFRKFFLYLVSLTTPKISSVQRGMFVFGPKLRKPKGFERPHPFPFLVSTMKRLDDLWGWDGTGWPMALSLLGSWRFSMLREISWKWWKVRELQKNQPLNHLSNSGLEVFWALPQNQGICPVPSHDLPSKRALQPAVDLLKHPNQPTPQGLKAQSMWKPSCIGCACALGSKKMVVRFAGDFFKI